MPDTTCNHQSPPPNGHEEPDRNPAYRTKNNPWRGNSGSPRSTTLAGRIRAAARLVKAPLTATAALPAICAYVLAAPETSVAILLALTAGTLLAGFGASALNQWSEHSRDAVMVRTRERPIPAGQLRPAPVLLIGLALATAGVLILFAYFSFSASVLAAATVVLYWLVYTPLKVRTPWCTEAGAVAGAMPALIGSAAAAGHVTASGFVLFSLLFFWQMPHFHPIAWRYRDDYRQGGFRMLAVIDPTGDRAARRAWIYTWCMVAASLSPLLLWAGWLYGTAVAAVSVPFVWQAAAFRKREHRDLAAPLLFKISIVYLCVLLAALLLDHVSGGF